MEDVVSRGTFLKAGRKNLKVSVASEGKGTIVDTKIGYALSTRNTSGTDRLFILEVLRDDDSCCVGAANGAFQNIALFEAPVAFSFKFELRIISLFS